jgi:DNA-binding response OmpR family regulator
MRKILIVDDDEALRRLMRIELSDDYEVIDSGEPEQGLALALEHHPDVILLDLHMPKYSGQDLLKTFTTFGRTQLIPVIIVSGEGAGQTKEQCKQLGAAGYFEKPFDFDALRVRLHELAKTRRYTPRSEVRVRLHVPLKLQGTDIQGKKFEHLVTSEDVSLSGFLCSCAATIATASVVEVYMMTARIEYVGKAKVIHASPKGTVLPQYGFRFIEKTGPWVLQ